MKTTTTTHTPGPWKHDASDVLNPDRAFGIIAHDDAEGPDGDATQCVAEICDGPTAEADARLIASAPTLLAACEEIVRYYQEMSGNPNAPIPDRYWIRGALMARDAIAAATGK